ncbi:MAG: HAMP domain-containing sensor histidine kinase, partial [Candidatus Omnitrophota bacterium]
LKLNLEEVNSMIQIVDDLVLLTKIDYNPSSIQKEPFDFIKFFTEIQQRAQMLVSHKQINFSATIPQTPITVQGNKLHLSRLFLNIIQNAVKFTPSGGSIALTVHPQGRSVKVSISDTGPGISTDVLPRIFQRFFQKDKFKSRSGDGIGLGLSIAKSIAQFHNGHIEVKSKLGEGSTFVVSLPMVHP